MTVRTRAQLKGDADTYLPDNAGGLISPEDVRERVKDIADSAQLAEDLGSAAYADTGDFATAAQGSKADSAVQPSAIADMLTSDDIGSSVQGYDAATLKGNVADQTISGGARITVLDLGSKSSGTVTPDPGDRPHQKYTNTGAHTLAPGSNYGDYYLDIINGSGAGAITTTGWTKVSGDSFTTTNGHKFRCGCSVTADGSTLVVLALQ